MKLTDIHKHLSTGELSSLALSGDDTNGISAINYPKVNAAINIALTAVHTRFPLATGEVVIQQHDHIQLYRLHSDFAKSNEASTEPGKYIEDSIYTPFQDNVLKIEKAFNEDGQELFLNQPNEYWSLYTPRHDTIQVPWPEKENAMIVHFRAKHPDIPLDTLINPMDIEIRLPEAFLQPVLQHIASRLYEGPDLSLSGVYSQKYLQSMDRLELEGVYIEEVNDARSIADDGWV